MTNLLTIPNLETREDGHYFSRDGLNMRLVPGDKAQQYTPTGGPDWVLEWETPEGWRAVSYATLGIMITSCADNEERIAPQPRYRGRAMLADAVSRAALEGWHTVPWSKA